MTDIPAFEVISSDGQQAWKIFADGRTEGFPLNAIIFNRIPSHVAAAVIVERETQRDRVVKMLSGIADILAKNMTNKATPELLRALAEAVKSSDSTDLPEQP